MPETYYDNPRNDVIDFLSLDNNNDIKYGKVLELGCASGSFGVNLKNKFKLNNFDWTGVEQKRNLPNSSSNYSLLGRCIHEDLISSLKDFESEYFDCIFALDVLEHLEDPINVMVTLREKIKSDGTLIITIPNVSHYSVIISLLQQKWNYKENGILDKTHLRFYTPLSFIGILEKNGWLLKIVEPINSYDGLKGYIFEIIKKLFPKFLINYFSYGHIYKFKKR